MKIANQLGISPLREGLNLLKVYPSHKTGTLWSRPVSINLLITSRCNSKCITCDSWKLTDHAQELDLDDFRRLAAETAEMKIPIVTIGGGEPTLRPDIWEIIRAFKDSGRVVQLTTNALTLKEGQRRKLYASLLDRVTVSIDSHLPDVYAKIRGVDSLGAALGALRSLMEEKPGHLEVDTNTVLCADNADTFLDTIDFLLDLNVPKINISAVTTSGTNYLMTESKASLAQISPDKIEKIVNGLLARKKGTKAIPVSATFIKGLAEYYADPSKVVYPCYAGYLTLDVFQNGAVHGCGNLASFANVKKQSLQEIWRGKAAQVNRMNMAEGRCPNCYVSCKIELAIAANPRHIAPFAVDKLLSSV